MTDLKSDPISPSQAGQGDDPLSHLHKMSTTAGLGSTDYVAVNGLAVATVFVGLASALSLMDNSFLVIPLVAIVMAVTALRQIGQSNGTQTGKAISWLGLILALGFAGSVGGRDVYQTYTNRADTQAIDQLITNLDQHVRAGEFSKTYEIFSGKFTSRVSEQVFADTWRRTVGGINGGPKLTSIAFNGNVEFDPDENTGVLSAAAMTIFKFDRDIPDQRIVFVCMKNPDGSWQISDIPVIFPTQQQPPTRKR